MGEDLELVERLADEFAGRFRRGDIPLIRGYIYRYPEQARIIRDTFEALALMENLAPGSDDSLGQAGQPRPPEVDRMPLGQLGDFRILREVGRGGMGIVYEAEQVSLGRHVALKVLAKEMFGKTKHRLRFEREARTAAKLHHTSIVPVFGVGEDDGSSYYVMSGTLQPLVAESEDSKIRSREDVTLAYDSGAPSSGTSPSNASRGLSAEIAANPESTANYLHRARLYARLGDWRGSADDHLRAVELTPQDRLAWLQTDQAHRTLAEATESIPVQLRTLGTDKYDGLLPVPDSTIAHDWLIPEILRREAERLILSPDEPLP